MTDKIAVDRDFLEHAVVGLEYAYNADDEMVQESIKYLRAALAAQPAPAAVPPGYALVPMEPTQEMVDAGDVARHSVLTQARTSVIYRAMIAAAGDKP